ncbi:MAG: GCN5-related N-acetyltransferase [Frankiales bacterium]|nr:GCN5-related N-acetyltransferase [Frankiales bacterium]
MTWTTRPCTLADAAAVSIVYAAFDTIEFGEQTFDASDVAVVMNQGAECHVAVDDGGLVGFCSVHREGDVETVVLPSYPPALREDLLGLVLDRARELGLAKVSHWAGLGGLSGPFLAGHGFRDANTSWKLVRPLPAPAPTWPEGIEVRPFVLDRDARDVWACVTVAFRGTSFGRDRTFEEWSEVQLEHLVDVVCAWQGDELVGVSTRGTLLGQGYLAQLGVRPSHRGRGLGRALLLETFARDAADGHRETSLSVDGENDGARRSYDSVGMTVASELHRWDLEL